MVKRVGVLALQGDFAAHGQKLRALGSKVIEIRNPGDVDAVDGIVLPGGESGVMLRLMSPELRSRLYKRISEGTPTLSTCAGTILLAKTVTNPVQDSFGLIGIDIERNAYGRQLDSFIARDVPWTAESARFENIIGGTVEAVFIRAPRIIRVGPSVKTLIHVLDYPALVTEGNIFAATFHPELSHSDSQIHKLFLSQL